eukprot:COSAG02_NODE_14474_length_1267_cov_3.012842_2_plen_106_part_00
MIKVRVQNVQGLHGITGTVKRDYIEHVANVRYRRLRTRQPTVSRGICCGGGPVLRARVPDDRYHTRPHGRHGLRSDSGSAHLARRGRGDMTWRWRYGAQPSTRSG